MKHFRDLLSTLASDHISRRRTAWVVAVASLAVTACGSAGTSPSSPASSPTPAGPAGGQFTVSGDFTLLPTVAGTAVTCSFPSLNGPEITMFVQNAAQSLGGFITLSANQVYVRIGAGSGTKYTQRNFAGPGVTQFNAATGAHFTAQLADTTPPGQPKGTIGSLTRISGSVSCGSKKPGGGSVTITGDSPGGAISGALSPILVNCPAGKTYALINGLSHVGSTPAAVEIGGGTGEVFFASISTTSAGYFYSSSAAGLYTVANGHVRWNNAVLTESGGSGGGVHKVTVNGDATCGS